MTDDPRLQHGNDYRARRAYDKALACFRDLALVQGYEQIASLETGKTYKMMNDPERAIETFIHLLSRYPGNTEALRELQETAHAARRYEAILRFLDGQRSAWGYVADKELLKVHMHQGDLAAAETALQAVSAAHPEDPEIPYLRGMLLAARGDLASAVDQLEKVRHTCEDRRACLHALGDLYQRMGKAPEAVQAFRDVIDAGLATGQTYLKLVEIYSLIGDPVSSEQYARLAMQFVPGDPLSRDNTLNDTEVLQGKTELLSKAKRLWVTVTTRCNIRCKTCGLWHKIWDLPYETAREVMAYYPYLDRVVWLGGEVFFYEHFEEMFDAAAPYPHLRQQIITNGVAPTERWIRKILMTPNVEFTFSVDGATKEVYESIRHGSNFEKLLENIRLTMRLKRELRSSVDIRMNVLVMRSNYHQMEELLAFAAREGFTQLTYLSVHFAEATDENVLYDHRDPAVLRHIGQMIPKLRAEAARLGIDLDILLPPGELDFEALERLPESPPPAHQDPAPCAQEQYRPLMRQIHCRMPWKYMMICDNGDVLLTGSCVQVIGNIHQQTLDQIWNSEKAQEYRRSMLEHKHSELCREECLSRWQQG